MSSTLGESTKEKVQLLRNKEILYSKSLINGKTDRRGPT